MTGAPTTRVLLPLTAITLAIVLVAASVAFLPLWTSTQPGQTITTTIATTTTTQPGQTGMGGPCDPFPPHGFEYENGQLRNLLNNATIPVESRVPMNLSRYPNLPVRQGYLLERMIFAGQGGDAWAFIVAVCQSSQEGFAIQPMNGTQGGFVFGPITDSEKAAEYAEFMGHETQVSFFDRQHQEIKSEDEFATILEGMKERAKEQNLTLEYDQFPPYNHTVVIQTEGGYLVHRVFFSRVERERLSYWLMEVQPDGAIRTITKYTFLTGVPGFIP